MNKEFFDLSENEGRNKLKQCLGIQIIDTPTKCPCDGYVIDNNNVTLYETKYRKTYTYEDIVRFGTVKLYKNKTDRILSLLGGTTSHNRKITEAYYTLTFKGSDKVMRISYWKVKELLESKMLKYEYALERANNYNDNFTYQWRVEIPVSYFDVL